ncbi:hypothetical protein EON82_17210 [bacterium]|nr:MAG: hypothetical protein EON82_17210 [bacterium]
MKRLAALSFLLVAAVALANEYEVAKVSAVVKNPAKFDGKKLSIKGKVAKFKAKTSKAGNPYFTFKLEEGKEQISVYGRGKLKSEPKNGDTVTVSGKFAKEKKLGDLTFKNEIDVTEKPGEGFGVKK